MSMTWDSDIAALSISDVEKNGLQVFRNYSRAFERKAAQQFISESDNKQYDISKLEKILNLIAVEDIRFLPVIAASFADDQLEEMFKREIPESVPGGRASMLSGFGSLSRFSQRIQVAYAFNWMTRDVLQELDHLRKIRNDTSHNWDIESVKVK